MKSNSAIAEVKIVRSAKSSSTMTNKALITALKLGSLIKPAMTIAEDQ